MAVRKSSLKQNDKNDKKDQKEEREPLLGSPISQPPVKQARQDDISESEMINDIQHSEASSSTQQQVTGFVQGDVLVTGAGWQAAISETPPGIPPFPGAGSVDDKKELSMQDLMQAINQVKLLQYVTLVLQ